MEPIHYSEFVRNFDQIIAEVERSGIPVWVQLQSGSFIRITSELESEYDDSDSLPQTLAASIRSAHGSLIPSLEDCWAKTNSKDMLALTTFDHCVNVGAVATLVRNHLPPNLGHLLPTSLPLLAALHDIGKISVGFQWKSPEWRFFRDSDSEAAEGKHARISQAHFGEIIADRCTARWSIALGGHHGKYESSKPRISGVDEPHREWGFKLRQEITGRLVGLFGIMPAEKEKIPDHLIHLVTGYITFSDWIGSNEDFFPLATPARLKHETNLAKATGQAKSALEQLRWSRPTPSKNQNFHDLFPFPPNPLQKALLNIADSPGLYIVEATMGMGKTEAALALAAKRWRCGDEQGLYFALPTQLTSNRIHERIRPFLKEAIQSDHANALVHGSAWLSEERISPVNVSGPKNEAMSWFASSRRALLAPFGVGTIDQALLSILPVKHSALRLFALAGKTIVLDEVHSFDPYTFALICRFVEILTSCGSTVIILSATLTSEARRRLIEAAGGKEASTHSAYPLISAVKFGAGDKATCYAELENHATDGKPIILEHLSVSSDDFHSQAISAAEAGACVLIIRNTVQSAQDTYKALTSEIRDGLKIGLLHSRFPFFARQEKETHWVESLSKDKDKRPKGCILVSTQVVEQSIDIDADLLITDLAPADLLLQRIGRLHRHRETIRPPEFEKARTLILHPELHEQNDPKLLKKELGKSVFIYPPDSLLRAHYDWKSRDEISLPSQIRELLEQENEHQREVNPAELTLRELTDATISAQLGMARTRTLNMLDPLSMADDDQGHQTRWNSLPSSMIILLSEQPELVERQLTLCFLNGETHTTSIDRPFDFALAKKLHLNSAKVPSYTLPRGSFSKEENVLANYFFEHAVCAVLEERQGGRCLFPGATNELPYEFTYTSEAGVSLCKSTAVERTYEPEDDGSWF